MSTFLQRIKSKALGFFGGHPSEFPDQHNDDYQSRMHQELSNFADDIDIHSLPDIFHYWSNRYVRPWFENVKTSHPEDLFARFLLKAAEDTEKAPRFLSIGSGNCDAEIAVAKDLLERGLDQFTLECMDINPKMLDRGRDLAKKEGMIDRIEFQVGDFNNWEHPRRYHGIIANQCLHHVTNLEGLFDEIKSALTEKGLFITSDMIGRNGHMRWPEALEVVEAFWEELPNRYRYNHQCKQMQREFVNFDCSVGCFEGIRAQDILPLLIPRFAFHVFIGFGNAIDPFIDRAFGHNFDAQSPKDRDFIDRVHAADEAGFAAGTLKPTHMVAVMSRPEHQPTQPYFARGLTPERAVRLAES